MKIEIDINFDFRSDTPSNKDIDAHSPTLRRYHKYLWSKDLPNGTEFELDDNTPKAYLHHKSDLGEFFLSSDAITHSYRHVKKMAHIISQVPKEKVESLYKKGCTIGAYIIFPSNKIDNKMTINGARGINAKIKDRFDLTLECVHLFYAGKTSPLSDTLHRYSNFFNLFVNFKGYVEFFLLQDLVSDDFSTVKFHLPFNSFEDNPLPDSVDKYLFYRERTIDFVAARNQRIQDNLDSKG